MFDPTDPAPFLASFDRFRATIVGAEAELEFVRRAIVDDYSRMNDPKRLSSFVRDSLAGIDWQWPWFDLWRDRFVAMGVWPFMWKAGNPDRAHLLMHSIIFARHRRFTFDLVRFSPPNSDEPELVFDMIKRKIDAYAAGASPAILPPYFPGDRTQAHSTLPRKRPEPEGVIVCSFRGYGDEHRFD